MNSTQAVLMDFEQDKVCYFQIVDENDKIMLSCLEKDSNPGKALAKLRKFLAANEGYFTISTYSAPFNINRRPSDLEKLLVQRYNIEHYKQQVPNGMGMFPGSNSGMNGMGAMSPEDPRAHVMAGGPNLFQMLGEVSNVTMQMKLMEKDHEHRWRVKELEDEMNRLKEEQAKSRGMGAIVDKLGEQFSDPQVLLGLIAGISQIFNKPQQQQQYQQQYQHPMNGVSEVNGINGIPEDVITESNHTGNHIDRQVQTNVNDRRQKMVNSVNELAAADPDFPENITKLAEIARKNPGVYKMAIQYLKTL
jgi:hypothetical protein